MSSTIRTIGHSSLLLRDFLAILAAHGVQTLVDVRSMPWSRRWPWFRRDALAAALRAHGVDYLHLGASLGGRPPRGKVVEPGDFDAALDRVLALAASRRVALMCAEADPANCHRATLLAPALRQRGARVVHLLAADRTEDHTVTAARIAGPRSMTGDLFEP